MKWFVLITIVASFVVPGNTDLLTQLTQCTFPLTPPAGVPLGQNGPYATIDPNFVTISGFSSGAFMAMQVHLAWSSIIKAAGMFAGGPYGQDYTNSSFPTSSIAGGLKWGVVTAYPCNTNVPDLVAQAKNFAAQGYIDPVSNVNGSKVYIFQGGLDPLVQSCEGGFTKQMYETLGAVVKFVPLPGATHTVPTDNFGGLCALFDAVNDGVNNCAYEGVFDMFSQILPGFVRPSSSSAPQASGSSYYLFAQSPFVPSMYASTNAFMDTNGYIYVPPGCQNTSVTCRLHVALHGCLQSVYDYDDLLGNLFATKTGYTQVADANNIVIVFPQAAPSCGNLNQFNFACWDYFGGLSPDFPLQSAPQMQTVYNIIASLTGRPLTS